MTEYFIYMPCFFYILGDHGSPLFPIIYNTKQCFFLLLSLPNHSGAIHLHKLIGYVILCFSLLILFSVYIVSVKFAKLPVLIICHKNTNVFFFSFQYNSLKSSSLVTCSSMVFLQQISFSCVMKISGLHCFIRERLITQQLFFLFVFKEILISLNTFLSFEKASFTIIITMSVLYILS